MAEDSARKEAEHQLRMKLLQDEHDMKIRHLVALHKLESRSIREKIKVHRLKQRALEEQLTAARCDAHTR